MTGKYVEVKFGSLAVKFYALTVGQIQNLEDEMRELTTNGPDPFSKDRMAKLIRLYTASAQRGDPNITEAEIKKLVDLENIRDINRAVLGVLGRRATDDTTAKGEEGPTSPQIGGDSIPE